MIEVKHMKADGLQSYHIYVNGDFYSDSGFYDKEDEIIITDDSPEFDITEISEMKTEDFPDNFSFGWRDNYRYSPVIDAYDIIRRGDKITIAANGSTETMNEERDWLLWNPCKLTTQLNAIAIDNGLHVETYEGDKESICITFDFKTEGTIGEMVAKVNSGLQTMLREAEMNLLQLALKRLKP